MTHWQQVLLVSARIDTLEVFGRAVLYASVVSAVATIFLWRWRHASAAKRHLVAISSQLLMILVPIVGLCCPGLILVPVGSLSLTDTSSTESLPIIAPSVDGGRGATTSHSNVVEDKTAADAVSLIGTDSPRSGSGDDVPPTSTKPNVGIPGIADRVVVEWPVGLLLMWWMGTAYGALRLGLAQVRLLHLECTNSLVVPPKIQALWRTLVRQQTSFIAARIRVSADVSMPMTWGVFRPIVMLPPWVATEKTEVIRSVIEHELAHVRRRDALSWLISQICLTIYWFNPLCWVLRSWTASLAEFATDDRVLEQRLEPLEYAQHLVSVARRSVERQRSRLAVSMITPTRLEHRIAAILDLNIIRSPVSRRFKATCLIICLLLILPVTVSSQSSTDASPNFNQVAALSPDADQASEWADIHFDNAEWESKRLTSHDVIRGHVRNTEQRAMPNIDVGTGWIVSEGNVAPTQWVISDEHGYFELSVSRQRSPMVVMAMDASRATGGYAIVPADNDPVAGEANPTAPRMIDVEIDLAKMSDVRGDYWTGEVSKRPQRVWTSVSIMPDAISIIEQDDRAPFFSFRLPPGRHRLRGIAVNFQDTHRDFSVGVGGEVVDLGTLPLVVSQAARLFGQAAPDWKLKKARGIDLNTKLADSRGKWVVLEFWGVWCGPCIRELDQLVRFSHARVADREQFEIITVHCDLPNQLTDLDRELPQVVQRLNMNAQPKIEAFPFPVVSDVDHDLVTLFGIDHYPTTIFIDPNGIVTEVNGIWGLAEILKGRNGHSPAMFAPHNDSSVPPPLTNGRGKHMGQHYCLLSGHEDAVERVAFLPGSTEFVTAGSDNTIRFWDAVSLTNTRTLRCMSEEESMHSYGDLALFVAKPGPSVGGYYYERGIDKIRRFPRLWTATTGYSVPKDFHLDSRFFGRAAVDPEGQRLAAFLYDEETKDDRVGVFDLARGTLQAELDVHGERMQDSSVSRVITFSPNGRLLAVAGKKGHALQVWDIDTNQLKWEVKLKDADGIASITFSADSAQVFCAMWRDTIEIRTADAGALVRTMAETGHRVNRLALSGNGRYLASAGIHPHPNINIWDVAEGRVVGKLLNATGARMEDLAWSSDGRYLVSVSGTEMQPGIVMLWDLSLNGLGPF